MSSVRTAEYEKWKAAFDTNLNRGRAIVRDVCEHHTLGSAPLVALQDLAHRYSEESQMLQAEFQLQSVRKHPLITRICDKLFALINHWDTSSQPTEQTYQSDLLLHKINLAAIDRDIDFRTTTIPGYYQSHRTLREAAFVLSVAWNSTKGWGAGGTEATISNEFNYLLRGYRGF